MRLILWLISNFNIQLNQDLSTSQADLSFYNLEVQRSTAVQVLAVIITFANCRSPIN